MADSPRLIALRRRVQSDPASTAFAQLADECCRLGRFEEAADCCRSGLAHHPSYLSAHVILGRALTELGQFDEAAAEFEFVLSSAPDNLTAKRGLAELHERRSGQSNGNEWEAGAAGAATVESHDADAAAILSAPSETLPAALEASEVPTALEAPEALAAPAALASPAAREAPAADAAPAARAARAARDSSTAVAIAEDPLATLETELRAFEEAHRPPPPDPAAEALAELEAWLVALRSPRSSRGAAPGG